MTTKRWVRMSSSSGSSVSQRTTSIARACPCSARRRAASVSRGTPRLRASRLPVPAGSSAMGVPVPANSDETARTVPSPPATRTRSTPACSARRAGSWPGSSTVVSSQSVGFHRAARTSASTRRRRRDRSSNLTGLRMMAARLPPLLRSRRIRAQADKIESTPPILRARFATAMPSSSPPTMSDRCARPMTHWHTVVSRTAPKPMVVHCATEEVPRRCARVRVTSTQAPRVMAVTWLAG